MSDTQLLTQLHQLLTARFNESGLRTLCFDLGVDYDDLPGAGKADKARELVTYMVQHDRLADLVRVGRGSRPDVPWPDVATAPSQFPVAPPPPIYHPSSLPQLPDNIRDLVFRNRAEELKTLRDHVTKYRVTTITGMGGIGKTILAQALVESLMESRPNHMPPMWTSFENQPDPDLDEILSRFCGYLDKPELLVYRQEKRQPNYSDMAHLTDLLLDAGDSWVVFDHLDGMLNNEGFFKSSGVASLFEVLFLHRHRAHLIITTRILPAFDKANVTPTYFEASTVNLKGVSPANGILLLRNAGLRKGTKAQLGELVRRVDGHPQALWVLSAEAKESGVAVLLANNALCKAGKPAELAHELFLLLSPIEQQLLKHFAVFRTPQPTPVLAALAGGGEVGPKAWRLLIKKSLLTAQRSSDPMLYALHPMIREVADAELSHTERAQAHLQAYEVYRAVQLQPASGWRDLNDIGPLLEAHHHAIQAGKIAWAAAILLEHALPDYLEQWVAQDRLTRLCRETLGAAPDKMPYAAYLSDQGYDRLVKNEGNDAERARLYRQLGKCARYLDAYERASECYEQGLLLLGEQSDMRELVRFHRDSAFVLQRLAKPEEALSRCRLGLGLILGVSDRQGLHDKATLHMRAGVILLDDPGTLDEALAHFEQARAIFDELGMAPRAYEAYDNMGVVRSKQGRHEEALAIFTEVHQYYEEIKYRVADGLVRLNLGDELKELQRYEEARSILASALAWFEEIDDQLGQLISLYNLGDLRMKACPQDYQAAAELLERALDIATKTGNEMARPDILCLLGEAYARAGRLTKARERLEEAAVSAGACKNQQVVEKAQQLLAEFGLR